MCSHHLLFLFLKVICQLCYPFGETEGDLIVPVQDDGSSLPVLLNQPFPFYASNETTLFVSSPKIVIPLFLRKVIVCGKNILSKDVLLHCTVSILQNFWRVCACLCWMDVTSPCLHRSYSCGTVSPACKVGSGQLNVYIDELL